MHADGFHFRRSLSVQDLCAIRSSLQVLVKHPNLRAKEFLTLQNNVIAACQGKESAGVHSIC